MRAEKIPDVSRKQFTGHFDQGRNSVQSLHLKAFFLKPDTRNLKTGDEVSCEKPLQQGQQERHKKSRAPWPGLKAEKLNNHPQLVQDEQPDPPELMLRLEVTLKP